VAAFRKHDSTLVFADDHEPGNHRCCDSEQVIDSSMAIALHLVAVKRCRSAASDKQIVV
jgi:hypothetical protein